MGRHLASWRALVTAAALLGATAGFGQAAPYTLVDLGVPAGAPAQASVSGAGLNNQGVAVGNVSSNGNIVPFVYSGGVTSLVSDGLAGAYPASIPVGVNVNSFQNFNAADQQVIVEQLKRSGIRFVRTSLRPDDKNMNLAKTLQAEGIGMVLVTGPVFATNAQPRPADETRHMRSAMPLSSADPDRSRAFYQTVFDKLDEEGIVLAGVEVGNELNWCDFNGDFPIPGEGRAFTLEDLSRDPEAKKIAQGFLQYLKVVAVLKAVRDHSKLNKRAPIISAGMAAAANTQWLRSLKVDGVSIPATYAFLRGHGLDALVDGYGVHDYPPVLKSGDKAAIAQRNAQLDQWVFPPDNAKPYWLTEWGFGSAAATSAQDQDRARSVGEMRAYFLQLYRQGRLGGLFWYVWNEPDQDSIYRGGTLMDAGKEAIAPMPAR